MHLVLGVGVVHRFKGYLREEGGDCGIVIGGMCEGLLHQVEARFKRERAIASGEFVRQLGIVLRIGDGSHAGGGFEDHPRSSIYEFD